MLLAAAMLVPGTLQSQSLDSARAVLAKYRNPVTAVHDGYLSTVACLEYPVGGTLGDHQFAPGGMGVHFLNMGLIGAPLDPAKPQVLIYEPAGDSLVLVAAEWFVPVQVSKEQPRIFGQAFEGPMHGHRPVMPEELHLWDLHVWLWRENPAGMFSPTNANVRCPDGRFTFRDDKPTLVHAH
jgi:hypothetical protein